PPISVTPEQEKIQISAEGSTKDLSITATVSREQLLASGPTERQQMLETYLLKCLASLLQRPLAHLDPQQPLASLLDSLLVLMLKSRIETDLQVRAPMENFLGNSTIAQLTELLLNQFALANLIASEIVSGANVNEAEERERLSL
ncbi:MAG: phosphopantetheine-binding protein, partial [Pseudanabaenales cyanobacterium]|nr:phosphopantetheine-binding protein [Pseudanabaenales cyanobacterium]